LIPGLIYLIMPIRKIGKLIRTLLLELVPRNIFLLAIIPPYLIAQLTAEVNMNQSPIQRE
jgi:hypothetical protein